ncbi:glycine--tRNA ligase subunit beta [Amaricoccus solimangrovi]|uniref:Glycine--tRNA ligase beta subunit n=1 Tax=Amaricoccus solimangrovi TaxID=2589815 RepID=A0A501WLV7_9RHOB|nr:glycine--tRNA ligase subunit beta [Amaricoccus solimangrovi]TPE50763.1 glycine--tRNA ligase subunit beta [Amaricoccus solimangrovi]
MPDLLLELFSEEIPARMQGKAADDLKRLVTDGLVERGLTYAHAAAFATPRRLTLAIEGLSERSALRREERKGPRLDAPAKAREGFLRAIGASEAEAAALAAKPVSEIAIPGVRVVARPEKKSEVLFALIERPGREAAEIVAETVEAVIRAFPWPKSMRWGAGSLRWVRPLRSILCLLTTEAGAEVVPFGIDGIPAGNLARGHRFMAPDAFAVSSFEDYEAKLARAFVILDPKDRAERIWHEATQLAFAQGLEVIEDKGLLAEIAGLVEWPVVLMGRIAEPFLHLPPEVLSTSMKEHQKFLSVRDPGTGRVTGYVVVANRETADDGAAILAGNAKVLAARLSDAVFFWENDLRTPLDAMTGKLGAVTFHNRLGTQGARIARIAALAREIAPLVKADPDLAERAAKLAKADLASQMVYEFPELQGVMGKYYAEKAGEDGAVALAAEQHYSPLGPSDFVPSEPVPVAVALADKLDTLTGFWAIDEKPTGSKDPFALRRAALGVIRLLLENGIRLPLTRVLLDPVRRNRAAMVAAGAVPAEDVPDLSNDRVERECALVLAEDLLSFFADRLKVYLRDQGIRHDVIDAAYQLGGQDDLTLLVARVRALSDFLATREAANLLQGYRRAVNILEAEEKKDGVEYSLAPEPKLAETHEEGALFDALDEAEAAIGPALGRENFEAAMSALAGLRAPIDDFFETTVVNAPSAIIRRNRLCLLNRIRAVMNQVAIFSAVEG